MFTLDYSKNWIKNNKERSSAYHKNYKKLTKKHVKNEIKKYREKNKERFKAKDDRPCFDLSYLSLRMWARDNPNHPLVNNMNPSKWATQFILTPQELEEYKKTHSVE